jgi:hypothetical protein
MIVVVIYVVVKVVVSDGDEPWRSGSRAFLCRIHTTNLWWLHTN